MMPAWAKNQGTSLIQNHTQPLGFERQQLAEGTEIYVTSMQRALTDVSTAVIGNAVPLPYASLKIYMGLKRHILTIPY